MKRLILLIAIAGFFTQTQAQKLEVKDVPVAVTSAFTESHESIVNIDWSKEGNNYVAEYNADNAKTSVTYDASGVLTKTQVEILVSALPFPVMEYLKKNDKEEEVKEASKITDANGTVTYETKVKGMDLIFDSRGNFIKSVKK